MPGRSINSGWGRSRPRARARPGSVSPSDVAAELGVTRQTVYRLYKSADELLLAVGAAALAHTKALDCGRAQPAVASSVASPRTNRDTALPSFATQGVLWSNQKRPQGSPISFLNRASQVRVLPGAPARDEQVDRDRGWGSGNSIRQHGWEAWIHGPSSPLRVAGSSLVSRSKIRGTPSPGCGGSVLARCYRPASAGCATRSESM